MEMLIIDDGSDNPVDVVQIIADTPAHRLPQVRLTRCGTAVGACAARNIGIAQALAKYVLFVDDDVEFVGTDLCSRLIDFAEQNPTIGIVALAELSPSGEWGFNLGPAGPPIEVARFHGCGALFRRDCIREIGGFFEPLNYYYEEFELSMRVINAGWRIVFHSQMLIVHHRDSRGRNARAIGRLISRNAFMTSLARFPWWMIPPAFFMQALQFSRACVKRGDYWGLPIVIGQLCRKLPETMADRKTLNVHALRRYRSLARKPILWKPQTAPNRGILPPY
jgi:GT2 family glycosyltransferase